MNDEFGGLKLLLSYEVKQDVINEYRQFVMRDYVPSMHNLGFQMSEAWHTAYGDAPNRLIGFVCRDRGTLDSLLDSSEWTQLNSQLGSYVTDFSFKVVPYRGVFQF
jgi:hypothetical protein